MKTFFGVSLTILTLPFIGAGFVARIIVQAAYFGWTAGETLLGKLFSE